MKKRSLGPASPRVSTSSTTLRNDIFLHSIKILSARLIQIPLQIIMGLIIPKLVSPERYGLWRSLLLIKLYGNYSHMGTYQTMAVEMPYVAGKGEWETRKRICNNTFYYNLFISLFIGIGLILISFFVKGEFSGFYRHGFRVFAFVVLSTNLIDFFYQLLRVEKEFPRIGVLTIVATATNVVLAVGLLNYLQNVVVLAYAIVISNIIALTLAIKKSGWPGFKDIQILEMWRQIRVGFPLMLIGIMFEVVRSTDQIFIITFLRPEDMGYYGVALSIQRMIYLIPGVLASTSMPYLFEEFGRTDSAIRVSHMFETAVRIVSLICAFTVVGMYVFIHLPIKYYLPQYLPALTPLYILLIGIFGMGLLGVADNFIIINGKGKTILKWQGAALVLSIASNFAAIKLGYGIVGVATATVVTYIFYSTGILYSAYSQYIKKRTTIFINIANLYVPFLYLCLFLVVITQVLVNTGDSFLNDLLVSCARAGILLVIYIPLLIFYDRKLKVLATIKSSLMRNRGL